MICPNCNDPMVILELKEVEIDYCFCCEGIWLDQGELELLLEKKKENDRLLRSIEIDRHSREKKVKCPICRKKMVKVTAGSEEKIQLDKCVQDHGFWFDKGELEEILKMGSENSQVISLLKDIFNK